MKSILLLTLLSGVAFAGEPDLALLPDPVLLSGSEDRQRVLVLDRSDEEFLGSPDGSIEYTVANPEIAAVADGVVTPLANGHTTLAVTVGERSVSVPVIVSGMDRPHEWQFRHHVLPVLSKLSCNSGACHGALAGKGGLKLSLRGYDPVNDHFVLTKENRGRRIELSDPGRSLLLAKPSGAIPHKGGFRFETDSKNYRVLAEWIRAGAKAPAANDVTLESVRVLPQRVRLSVGDTQQVVVLAKYSDGRTEDVTEWAKFTSANEAVCRVDESGEVDVIGYGEGAVTVWFSSQIAISRITSPYPNELDAEVFASEPTANFIDELVIKQLRRLNLPPSPMAEDSEFVRRVYLDTIGKLPTPEETTAFLDDPDPNKHARLVDELLDDPAFVDYWTHKWSDLLLINGTKLRPPQVKSYYMWIRGHVESNTPWDEFVHELLTAQGSSIQNGATNFYALHQTPEDMTENASQAFLGLSIACAKCHNHPLEKWTNDQYYGMANLFSRVRAKGWGGDPRNGDGRRTLYVVPEGELVQPLTGKPQPPAPLDGEALPFDDPNDRREHLARWMTAPENPYFARAITNRVWANFLGVGLVENIDDLRVSNPASNEELLSAAAAYLVENDFDLKALMRAILTSRTYRRSSEALAGNKDENRFYSRYYPKRLIAEVMLDAISDVTGVPSEFNQIAFPGADVQKTDFYPKGTRAVQLYDSAVKSYFLKAFGRHTREITCDCERSDEPSMVQVLHISNGNTLNGKLAAKGNRIDELLKSDLTTEELIERVYLLCLSRRPSESERNRLVPLIGETEGNERRVVVEDLLWALMSSREFLFNH